MLVVAVCAPGCRCTTDASSCGSTIAARAIRCGSTQFVQQAELTPSDGVGCNGDCGDQFGYSVATSGNTVVVGAPYHEANSQAYSGAVYVFQMPAAGWASATQTAELSDSTLGGDEELGFSVAISSDGDTIVAGAPAGSEAPPQEHVTWPNTPCSQGTVDVFTTTGGWASTSTPAARLTVAGSQHRELPRRRARLVGRDLGHHDRRRRALRRYVSRHRSGVRVQRASGGGWSGPQTQAAVLTASPSQPQTAKIISAGRSGSRATRSSSVRAPRRGWRSKTKARRTCSRDPGRGRTQTQTAELTASDPTSNDQLGFSVAVSGNTVVAGAHNHQVGSSPTRARRMCSSCRRRARG